MQCRDKLLELKEDKVIETVIATKCRDRNNSIVRAVFIDARNIDKLGHSVQVYDDDLIDSK